MLRQQLNRLKDSIIVPAPNQLQFANVSNTVLFTDSNMLQVFAARTHGPELQVHYFFWK